MSWREGRRRNVCRKIYFTPEEWSLARHLYLRLKDGRHFTNYGQHARDLLIWGHCIQVVTPFDPSQLRGQLTRIGTNINQIAHQANTADHTTQQLAQQALDQCEELRRLFLQLSDEYERKTRGL